VGSLKEAGVFIGNLFLKLTYNIFQPWEKQTRVTEESSQEVLINRKQGNIDQIHAILLRSNHKKSNKQFSVKFKQRSQDHHLGPDIFIYFKNAQSIS
jgi:hypothetical protein